MKRKTYMFIILMVCLLLIFVLMLELSKEKNKTYAIGTTLVDTVKTLNKGNSWSSGANGVYYTNNHEYRYIGSEVNNYVKFNDDMYQIIGVFDSNSHGKNQELVKLIRTRYFNSYSWGVINDTKKDGVYSNYTNDWTGDDNTTPASVNILLNEYFYNKTNTSDTYGECSNWTYYSNSNDYKTKDCETIIGYGIKEKNRNYIETVTWYLNGPTSGTSVNLSASDLYLCERGQYGDCTSGNLGSFSAMSSSKIGLMYSSDYIYASGYRASNSTATSTTDNGSQNWLFKGNEWTITPIYKKANSAIYITSVSNLTPLATYHSYAFRPTFYLKADVYVTGGDGSFDNPYTVACDTCG